jgi:hypothetical protein
VVGVIAAPATPNAVARTPTAKPAAASAASGPGWRRVDATIDPSSGTVSWRTRSDSGVDASGTATVAALQDHSIDALCFLSPDGARSGWIAVDNVAITG